MNKTKKNYEGTYCQERELEAISDSQYANNRACLCFKNAPKLPGLLSVNAAFGLFLIFIIIPSPFTFIIPQ